MKCPICKAEFKPPNGKSVANCPFCQEPLLKPSITGKCETLLEALVFIAEHYGADLLLNDQRLIAYLGDFLPKAKLERNILRQAFQLNIPAKLYGLIGKTRDEQQLFMARCIQRITDNYGTAKDLTSTSLWNMAEAMGWHKRPESEPEPKPQTPANIQNTVPPQAGMTEAEIRKLKQEHEDAMKALALLQQKQNTIPPQPVPPPIPLHNYRCGQTVFAKWPPDGYYYPGEITRVGANDADILFMDNQAITCAISDMVGLEDALNYMNFQGDWKRKGLYYLCQLTGPMKGNKVKVLYDDGAKETVNLAQLRASGPPGI